MRHLHLFAFSARLAFIAAVGLGACTSAASTGITTVACTGSGSDLTYASFGEAFISDNCLSCHTTQEQPHLNTQALVQANANKILQEAVYTTAMPQNADMTTDERTLLGEWLACGAP